MSYSIAGLGQLQIYDYNRPIIQEYYNKLISRQTDLERMKYNGELAYHGFTNEIIGGSTNHTNETGYTYNSSMNNKFRPVTNGMQQDYQLSHSTKINKYKEVPQKDYINPDKHDKIFKDYYKIQKTGMLDRELSWKKPSDKYMK